MSYKFPSAVPRQRQHHPLPPVQTYYPLSLADTPTTTLARPSTGFDLRTILLLLAAAAVGMWIYKTYFSKKKKAVRNTNGGRSYLTTDGPLRGLERVSKRIKQHAQLFASDGYEGASRDLEEAADLIEEYTRRTREQPLEE